MRKPKNIHSEAPHPQLLGDGRSLLVELQQRATAVTTTTVRVLDLLNEVATIDRLRAELQPLRDQLSSLLLSAERVAIFETWWVAKMEREFLELEAKLRDALTARGWHIGGQWPKLYVERAITVEVDEQSRRVRVSDNLVPATSTEIVAALEPLVRELIPRNFSEKKFIEGLAEAYDELRSNKPAQLPILTVYRQFILRQQKPAFWKDARSDRFVGLSIEQFRARLSRALETNVLILSDGRELRLLPPVDPKSAVFLYLPAEERFGFVGRIEFSSMK